MTVNSLNITVSVIEPLALWTGLPEATILSSLWGGLSLLLCLALYKMYRRSVHLKEQIERLQNDHRVANSSLIGMGQQILALEKRLPATPSSFEKPVKLTVVENPPNQQTSQTDISVNSGYANTTESTDNAYETSRQLLAQGADIEEVIKRSGLSYSEVSLMKSLVK